MLRHAIRRLIRARAFTGAAVATLALGIGGTAAVFTVVNSVLLEPLPFAHSERLVDVSHTLVVSGLLHVDQSDATYLLYRRDNRAFSAIGAYRATAMNVALPAASSSAQPAERMHAALTSASVFATLRVTAERGRVLAEQDDAIGAEPVAAISDAVWRRQFGADPNIIGRTITVDGVARRIVGVMPAEFAFPDDAARLWIPLQLDPAATKSAAFDYRVIGRLRDGVSISAATVDLNRILPRVPAVFPGRLTAGAINSTHMAALVRPMRDVVVGDVGRVLWIVFGAVALLLVIACANVANLFLARAESRHRELAVRSALGAAHTRLLAELLSEAIVIGGLGGGLGLACAEIAVRTLRTIDAAATIPRLSEVHLDARVTALTIAIAALCALVVSALPLIRVNAASLAPALGAGGRSATSGRSRHRARRALVVAQVALGLVLVFGAGLFVRSFAYARAIDPGFAGDGALAFRVAVPRVTYPATRDIAGVIRRALDGVRTIPGVSAAGVITKLPLDEEARQDSAVFVEDHPTPQGGIPDLDEINFISPGYFQAVRIPLLAGRLFDEPRSDGKPAAGPPEVIVSAAFASRYWKGSVANAIGRRVRMNPIEPWHVIVGVVGSVRGDGLEAPPSRDVYAPLVTMSTAGTPWSPRNLAFVVRSAGEPTRMAGLVRRAVAAVDPGLPLYRMMPVDDLVRRATARTRFTILLLAIAAVVATTIGAFGIYGVISYLVTLRTREIGVRLALGASAADVRVFVARQAIADAVIGIVIGLAAAVMLERVLGAAVTGVNPADPAALAGAAAILLATALMASWMPARRAARLDPAIALRGD